MSEDVGDPLTEIRECVTRGKRMPAERLIPILYDQLRGLARRRLAHRPPGDTLQATALVNEAFLRVVGDEDPGWDSAGHLYAALARAMRNIMVDAARRRGRRKHGGDRERVEFTEELAVTHADVQAGPEDERMVVLDRSLARLERLDRRKADVVMLRFFGGRPVDEVAHMLDISARTVEREWEYARLWLHADMSREDPAC